jgi:S4 domain protein YaaA
MTPIKIHTDYITLGQFLKLANLIDNGGAAKYFLASTVVIVNNENESRRGRKLYPDTIVAVKGKEYQIVK